MFTINDKVVCISDAPFRRPDAFSSLPVKGTVYVIRGFDTFDPGFSIPYGLLLVGISGQRRADGSEEGFNPDRFRKLADVKATQNTSAKEPEAH